MQCVVPSCTGWTKQMVRFPRNLLLQSRWKRAIEAGTGLRIPTYHCGALCSWHFGDSQTGTRGYWEPYRFLHISGKTIEVGSCRFCLRFYERKNMVSDKDILKNAQFVNLTKHALKINLTENYILKDICEECESKTQMVVKWLESCKKVEKEYKAIEIAIEKSNFKPIEAKSEIPDRDTEGLKYNIISFEVECMNEDYEIEELVEEPDPDRDESNATIEHVDNTLEDVEENSPQKIQMITKGEIINRPLKPIVKLFNFPPNIHSKRGPPRKKPRPQPNASYRDYLSKKCYICDSLHESPEDLVAHLSSQHCNGAPYKCNECNRSFKIITSYNRHLGFHDQSNRPLRCCYCTMGFKYSYSLLNHENREHGAKHPIPTKKKHTERNIPCLKCDRSFKNNYELSDHDRYVHQKLPGTTCKVCGKQFRNRSFLRKHHLVHTNDRPYNCVHCDAVFRNATSLGYHVAKKHDQEVVHGNKSHECDLCAVKMPTKTDLVKHIEAIHLGIT